MVYRTPPGKAEQLLTFEELAPFGVYKEREEDGEKIKRLVAYKIAGKYFPPTQKFMKWGNYVLPVGGEYDITPLQELVHRSKQGLPNIILVTGSPGSGKSWWALSLAKFLDPKFMIEDVPAPEPDKDRSQVAFDRVHLLHMIGAESPLDRGQVLILDEPQWAIDARTWYTAIQVDLTHNFESIRFKGITVIIVAFHRSDLDKRIRERLVTHQVVMQKWGVGRIYRFYRPAFQDKTYFPYVGTVELPMPDESICKSNQCLRCNFLYGSNSKKRVGRNPEKRLCKTLRAIYERRKKEYIDKMSAETIKKARTSMRKEETKKLLDADLVEILLKHRHEMVYNRSGKAKVEWVKAVLEEELGEPVGINRSQNIRNLLHMKYPSTIKKKEVGV